MSVLKSYSKHISTCCTTQHHQRQVANSSSDKEPPIIVNYTFCLLSCLIVNSTNVIYYTLYVSHTILLCYGRALGFPYLLQLCRAYLMHSHSLLGSEFARVRPAVEKSSQSLQFERGPQPLYTQRHIHVLQVKERHVRGNGNDVACHIEAGDVSCPRAEAGVGFFRVSFDGGVPLGVFAADGLGV